MNFIYVVFIYVPNIRLEDLLILKIICDYHTVISWGMQKFG